MLSAALPRAELQGANVDFPSETWSVPPVSSLVVMAYDGHERERGAVFLPSPAAASG